MLYNIGLCYITQKCCVTFALHANVQFANSVRPHVGIGESNRRPAGPACIPIGQKECKKAVKTNVSAPAGQSGSPSGQIGNPSRRIDFIGASR